MKDFLRNEDATILEWIVGLFGLLLLIIVFAIFAPINNLLAGIFIENGAPYAQMMFTRKMFMWGFGILGVLCLMYPFAASWRKTYDQGQYQYGGGLR